MTRRDRKIAALTPRARKLWDRLVQGEIYKAWDDRTPKAMDELIAAKLVKRMSRPIVFWTCWVPSTSRPARPEVIGN